MMASGNHAQNLRGFIASSKTKLTPRNRLRQAARFAVEALEQRQLLTAYTFTNTSSASATWTTDSNWSPSSGYPHTASDSAALNVNATVNQSISLGAAQTINSLSLGDTSAYTQTIAAGYTLTFNNGSSAATLIVPAGVGGTVTIAAPISLASDLDIINNSSQTLKLSGAISLGSHNLIVEGTGSGAVNITGAITGSGSVSTAVYSGSAYAGTLTLSGANTYTGNTTINSGTFALTPPTASDPLGGVITVASGATFDVNPSSHALTLSNAVTGSGTVNYTGTAREYLTGSWSGFTGTFNDNTTGDGELDVNTSVFGSAATVNIASGATFFPNGSATWANAFNITGTGNGYGYGALRLDNGATVSGAITLLSNAAIGSNNGTGYITSAIAGGTHGLTLDTGPTSTLALSGSNTYTGPTTLAQGSLLLKNSNALADTLLTATTTTGSLLFDSSVTSDAFTLAGLAGSTAIALQNNAGTPAAVALTVGGDNLSTTYTGVFSGVGSLTKAGTGTMTLPAAFPATATAAVTGGALDFGGTASATTTVDQAGSFTQNLTLAARPYALRRTNRADRRLGHE